MEPLANETNSMYILGILSNLAFYECDELIFEFRKEENLYILLRLLKDPNIIKTKSLYDNFICFLANLIEESEIILNFLLKNNLIK